jgi:hypothetical protein
MLQSIGLLPNPTAATICWVRVGAAEEPVPARVLHLSASGARLFLRRPLVPGRSVTVDLFNVARLFSCVVPMRVANCQEISGGGFVLGGTFTRQLDDEETGRLL